MHDKNRVHDYMTKVQTEFWVNFRVIGILF